MTFSIGKTEPQKDGSIRVYVRMRWQEGKDIETWGVVDVLTRGNGRLALDDVIFLKDPARPDDVDTPLSKLLAEGSTVPIGSAIAIIDSHKLLTRRPADSLAC